MGKKYRELVEQKSNAKRGARSVLNVLANWCGDDGMVWLNISNIADKSGLSVRAVQYALNTLVTDGELTKIDSGIGSGNKPCYMLNHANLAPIISEEMVQETTQMVQNLHSNGAKSAFLSIYGSSIDQEGSAQAHARTHEAEIPPPSVSIPEQPSQPVTPIVEEQEFRQALPGEYLPGLSRPKRYQMETVVTQTVAGAGSYGIHPKQFREMVDCLLDGCAKRALADTNTPMGEQALLYAQEIVLTLVEMDSRFRSVAGVQSIIDSWTHNDYRGSTPPTSKQVVEHASKMVAGKVKCERKDLPKEARKPKYVSDTPFIPDMFKPKTNIYAKVKPQ